MSCRLSLIASNFPLLNHYSVPNDVSSLDSKPEEFCSICAIKKSNKDTLTPEMLGKMWNIGLPTAARTLTASTHNNICSTELLSRHFKTNQSQLRYKQLSRHYGTFYVDFLKSIVKSICGYMGGTIYCNKRGFKKFFPCSSETQNQNVSSLRSFIGLIRLPTAIHSDNHNNFKEGLLKRLLRKILPWSSFTEPHS